MAITRAELESMANLPGENEKCFACDRKLGKYPHAADTRDDQIVYVGSECHKLIEDAGDAGYQPPRGGPKLYPLKCVTCDGRGWYLGYNSGGQKTGCGDCGGTGKRSKRI